MKVVLAAAAAALVLSACGDSEIGGAQGAFIEVVDARCAELADALAEAPSPETDSETVAAYVDTYQVFRDDLRGLDNPREESAVWDRYLANVDNTLHSLEALQIAVDNADDSRIERRLSDVRLSSAQGADVADGYGFEVCSQIRI